MTDTLGRRPSAAALAAAANGDWTSHATCRDQPDYTSQDPGSITYTCSRCSVAADCAQLGKLELARALTDTADRGEGRVYAGHQLTDLLRLARHNTAGRQAAYRALDSTLRASAAWSMSASGITIMWFLAPPSACTRFPACVPRR